MCDQTSRKAVQSNEEKNYILHEMYECSREIIYKALVLYIKIRITSTSLSDSAHYSQTTNTLPCTFPSSTRQLIC